MRKFGILQPNYKGTEFCGELIINAKKGKTLDTYIKMLKEAAKRIHHALKPGKYFTVILHEEDRSILKNIVKAINNVGFRPIKNDQIGDYNVYTFEKKVFLSLVDS